MDNDTIVVFIVLLFVAGAIALIILKIVNKGLKEKFRNMADLTGGIVQMSVFGTPRVEGSYEGIPFRILFERGGQYMPSYIRIRMLEGPGFGMILRQESMDTRVSKKIGLAKEAKIGIPNFDDKFFIQTNDKIKCKDYLSSDKRRDFIMSILDKGYTMKIELDMIQVSKSLRPKGVKISLPHSLIDEQEIINLLKDSVILCRSA